jgi:AraC-like DNA-binding protein
MIVACGREQHRLDHRVRREAGFPYWTMGGLLEGAARFTAGGASHIQVGRSLVLIRPGAPYVLDSGAGDLRGDGGRWREVWFILDPPRWWRDLLDWPEVLPGLMALAAQDGHGLTALTACEEAQQRMAERGTDHERFAANALERALLHARLAVPGAEDGALEPGVRAVRDWLAAAPAEPLTVARLARRARMSASHFAHRFAAQVGEPPMRFLERCRLDRARQLLLGGSRPIAGIAADCGFDNPFHFSTRFRRRFGRSPRAFRRDPRQ